MKRTLLALAALAFVSLAYAVTPRPAKLVWDANAPADKVIRYNIYEQTGPTTFVKVGETLSTVTEYAIILDGGPHTFAVTAENSWLESDRSLVGAPTAPGAPAGLQIIKVP